jgi:hypothetical protein
MFRYLALAAVLLGCAPPAVIRADDTTYRRALEHYKTTRRLITESLAPEDDQAMFLQAEGLWRYRFEAAPRSALSYVALAGAAIVQLPVLESYSGALDLYTLRVKTTDGAVQLWETLLARDPQTPLRPLVMYRLGWAYRNVIASGFPRTSDKAFDAVAADSSLAAYAAAAKQVAHKSQPRAAFWSIVPGGGQLYTGHTASGVIRLGIAVASLAAFVVPTVLAYERRDNLSWSADWPLLVSAAVGGTVLAFDYSSSYDDATRTVLEYNEQREAEFERAHPDAP